MNLEASLEFAGCANYVSAVVLVLVPRKVNGALN